MHEHVVVMAGPRGAGKTVLLSSMHKKLLTQSPEIGFFLSTDLGDAARLRAIYAQVAGHSWPPGNRLEELSEWKFTVRVQNYELHRYDACTFRYVDYAGGLLTGAGDSGQETYKRLMNYIQKADSILGMIDGAKILCLLKAPNHRIAQSFLMEDLPAIIETMNLPSGKVAMHFVISKWDLLQDEGVTLHEVRQRLLQIGEFRALIGQLKGHTVRLIPVSAVGRGFARPNPDSPLAMFINDGVVPRPYNVEMPLCCVLPDRLEALLRALKQKREEEEKREIFVAPIQLTWWERLKGTIAEVAKTIIPREMAKHPIIEDILKELSDPMDRSISEARKRSEELAEKKMAALKEVDSAEGAYGYMLRAFRERQYALDQEYGASRLEV